MHCTPRARCKRTTQRVVWCTVQYTVQYTVHRAQVLSEVSSTLKHELCGVMFAELARDLPFFHGRDASFVALVGVQLEPFFVLTGEYVCRKGVIGMEMYWLRKGRVSLIDPALVPAGQESTLRAGELREVMPGEAFGQEALLFNLRQQWDARALAYCDLLYLSREAVEELSLSLPLLSAELLEIEFGPEKQPGARDRWCHTSKEILTGEGDSYRGGQGVPAAAAAFGVHMARAASSSLVLGPNVDALHASHTSLSPESRRAAGSPPLDAWMAAARAAG